MNHLYECKCDNTEKLTYAINHCSTSNIMISHCDIMSDTIQR